MLESVNTPMKTDVQAYGFEEVLKVNFTKDLSKFKVIKGNRPPNPRHIFSLRRSIRNHGMLKRVILVNENFEVIDGQHRLEAAKQEGVGVYYIVLEGYNLDDVHVLNLNQKNWVQKDFLNGYADMGILDYVTLRGMVRANPDFRVSDIITMCTNQHHLKYLKDGDISTDKIFISRKAFKEGTWKLLSVDRANKYMDNLRLIKPIYSGYNRSVFVSVMIDLFNKPEFNFKLFLKKLKLQPKALVDCANMPQYKSLIEDIYNYRNQNKVNLRF